MLSKDGGQKGYVCLLNVSLSSAVQKKLQAYNYLVEKNVKFNVTFITLTIFSKQLGMIWNRTSTFRTKVGGITHQASDCAVS